MMRQLVEVYATQEHRGLSRDIALGSGPHLQGMARLLTVTLGEPVTASSLGRCVRKRRDALLPVLSRGSAGVSAATRHLSRCVESAAFGGHALVEEDALKRR